MSEQAPGTADDQHGEFVPTDALMVPLTGELQAFVIALGARTGQTPQKIVGDALSLRRLTFLIAQDGGRLESVDSNDQVSSYRLDEFGTPLLPEK